MFLWCFWYLCPRKTDISLHICTVWPESQCLNKKLCIPAGLPKIHAKMFLTRVHQCAVWSESSLSTHARRYFFWCCDSNVTNTEQTEHTVLIPACFINKYNVFTLVMLSNDARPTSKFQPIRLLDPGCWYKFTYWTTNSADPDQLASSEANWSGSTLFEKTGHIRVQQDQG